jgi:metal-responsive CopG/Arc/MetJ family transcriptional regulator
MHTTKGTIMGKEDFRTHIVLPREVVEDVDRLVGHRKRSHFMAEAVKEKLRREKLNAALEATAGILKDVDIPEWATPEKTSAWVRDLRREADAATERKLTAWEGQ